MKSQHVKLWMIPFFLTGAINSSRGFAADSPLSESTLSIAQVANADTNGNETVVILCALPCSAPPQKDSVYEVMRKIDRPSESSDSNIQPVAPIATAPLPDAMPVGKVRILEAVDASYFLASVEEEGLAIGLTPDFPYPFILRGDTLRIVPVTIEETRALSLEMSLRYDEVYDDPLPNPSTYELSPLGQDNLRKIIGIFREQAPGSILIKAYTDGKAAREANAEEARKRVEIIQEFIVDVLKFPKDQIKTIHLGELSPADASFTVESERRNRRIVIKSLPIEEL